MNKTPKSKVSPCSCICIVQDNIYGDKLRVWNPIIIPKGLKHVGWTCTGCGKKTEL